jgi:hypothetical protein
LDWNPEAVGGGYYLIRLRHNLNQCLNIPGGANNVWVTTWTCNANDPDQRFKIVDISTISANPPGTTPLPTSQTIVSNTTPLYEYWIVARKRNTAGLIAGIQASDVGHVFDTLVRRDQENVKVYINNVLTQNYNRDKGGWYPWHTYGFWPAPGQSGFPNASPSSPRIDDNCIANPDTVKGTECADVKYILRGTAISDRGQAVRKVKVTESRAIWISQNPGAAGCAQYLGAGGTGDKCNCQDYATRSWQYFLANRSEENFQSSGTYRLSPDNIVDAINQRNQSSGSDFVDNGNVWN